MMALEILAPVAYVALILRAYIGRLLKVRLQKDRAGRRAHLVLNHESA
jgi:hypothetical protein